jgi:hypothetical protein
MHKITLRSYRAGEGAGVALNVIERTTNNMIERMVIFVLQANFLRTNKPRSLIYRLYLYVHPKGRHRIPGDNFVPSRGASHNSGTDVSKCLSIATLRAPNIKLVSWRDAFASYCRLPSPTSDEYGADIITSKEYDENLRKYRDQDNTLG